VAAHAAGQLTFHGAHAALVNTKAFAAYLAPIKRTRWYVYAKRPLAGPKAVLAYLSRYTHRVAISNRRLIAADAKTVTFKVKHYRINRPARYKTMTLDAHEFFRRFLIHVLPTGFHRIRHYGLLASGVKADNLVRARKLLDLAPPAPEFEDIAAQPATPLKNLVVCARAGATARPAASSGGCRLKMINLGPESESDWRGANSPAKFHSRARRAIHFEATRPVQITRSPDGRWLTGVTGEDAIHSAIARLELGGPGLVEFMDVIYPTDGPWLGYWYTSTEVTGVDNIEFVNDWLFITQKAGTIGTDFKIVRHGDWDIIMKGLILILYRHGRKLKPQVYSHVLHDLLKPWSKSHDPGILVPFPLPCLETENHVLMIETTRYLTNQLLYLEGWNRGEHLREYDNQDNGLADWLLRLFKTYLQHDFWEFNSRPYQRYTIATLQNIYDFAWDESVKLAARMVMDYISAKTAVSSNGLRRAVPFRRLREMVGNRQLLSGKGIDAHSSRMMMLSGLLRYLPRIPISMPLLGIEEESYHADDGSDDQLLLAALSKYRVPEIILDLLMNKKHNSYYQRFFHGDRTRIHDMDLKGFVIRGGIEIYDARRRS
jgi:hypothetical protein